MVKVNMSRDVPGRGGNMYITREEYLSGTDPVGEDNLLFKYLSRKFFDKKDEVRHRFNLYGVRVLKSNSDILCFPYVSPKDKKIHDVQCLYYNEAGKKNMDIHPLWYYYCLLYTSPSPRDS